MYMKSLSYDGKEWYIESFCQNVGAGHGIKFLDYEACFSRYSKREFLIPVCKFDELMVLTGIQGVGKTSFIEKLALLLSGIVP